jgi:peptide/nickel transport system permease protein
VNGARVAVALIGPAAFVVGFMRDGVGLFDFAGTLATVTALAWPLVVAKARATGILSRLLADRRARWGAVLVVALLLVALWAPLLAPQSPSSIGHPVLDRNQAPGPEHWLGTDLLGRDLLSRVLHGARVSLAIAVGSVLVSFGLGTLLGAVAGWRGGWVDTLLMRATDLALAFPRVFLILLLVAFVAPSPMWIVVVLGLTGWMSVARLVRGEIRPCRNEEYVLAARSLGFGAPRILFRHVLPAVAGPLIAFSTLRVGNAILAESFLSFLGLGVQDPWVSWGLLIRSGRDLLTGEWWLAFFPGVAIVLTVVGFNLLGDGLRAALDPRRHHDPVALED